MARSGSRCSKSSLRPYKTAEWLQRRRALLNEAVDLHEQLWPAQPAGWVRRPPKPGARWMPPLPEPARRLSGWNLRTVCQALLRRFGALALPEMHALLHRYGYEIEGIASMILRMPMDLTGQR